MFGAHSPDAVKKLLALSETKVKTVKSSASSTSVPLAANTTSRSMLSSSANSNSSLQSHHLNGGINGGNVSPATPLSPRIKKQPVKHHNQHNSNNTNNNNNFALSSESSSVSTIKLNDSYPTAVIPSSNYSLNTHLSTANGAARVKANGHQSNNCEADSGRASMASNVDQDQCSPTFQHRAFILNRCM